jgi:hypothetical protein
MSRTLLWKHALEQFGGANGELAAAMQYSIQGINCEDMTCKDLLMDIGTEELSHLDRHTRAHASQANEEECRGRSKSPYCHRRRRRSCSLQLDGHRLES